MQRVLEEHYQNVESVEIPSEILVQYELPEGEILSDWLSNRKGRKVTILAPQRQTKAELIEMVERNAEYELARMQRLKRLQFSSNGRFSRNSRFARSSSPH